jgi:tetratricopeptide (TPR) repeat protein
MDSVAARFRARGPALAAAGALALPLAAYLIWGRSTPTATGPLEPDSLLILPLVLAEPSPQTGWLRHGLADLLAAELGEMPGIRVLARHRVADALREGGFGDSAPAAAQDATALALKLRAEKLVTGSVTVRRDAFTLSAQLVDVATGRTERTASERGRYPDDLLDRVDRLCFELSRAFGQAQGREPGAGLATRSLEASRLFLAAVTAFGQGGRSAAEEAEGLLDLALTRDPAFAQAFVKKAEVQQWRRQWGYGNPDPAPAVRAALRLVKRLPHRERLLVESFESLILKGQLETALSQWSSLLRLYPTFAQEVGVPALAADTLIRAGRWADVVLVGEAHVDAPALRPHDRARLAWCLAQAYRRRGELDKALPRARESVRLWPARSGAEFLVQRASLGRIALEAGLRDEALAEFRAIGKAPEADAPSLTNGAWGFYMAGSPREAEALAKRALALDPSYGNAHHLLGWILLASGDPQAAARHFEAAFERTPVSFGHPHTGTVSGDLAALYYAGVAYLRAGLATEAISAFERLSDLCHRLLASRQQLGEAGAWQAESFLARAEARLGVSVDEPRLLKGDDSTYLVQSARLHAVQGRRELALSQLARGLALGFGERQHIRDDPDFESLQGDPEFERLLRQGR